MGMLLDRITTNGQSASTGERYLGQIDRPMRPNPDIAYKYMWNAATVQPTVRIGIYPGYVSYEDDQPLITPDGGIIPETRSGSGQWAQLYRAGRVYGR